MTKSVIALFRRVLSCREGPCRHSDREVWLDIEYPKRQGRFQDESRPQWGLDARNILRRGPSVKARLPQMGFEASWW